jgi:hypothetical protein
MENLEIIVLTIVISTLFIIFILGPIFYAHKIQENSGDVYRSTTPMSQSPKTVREDKSPIIDPLPVFNSIATESISTVDSNENSEQNLQNLLSSLLKSPNLSATSKLELSLATSVAIKDMESNGIQFPEALKNSLIESIKPTNPA